MADKRFYWFKMESSFFEQKEIKYLRRLPGGDTYTIIYLKLILKSLENNGKIYYENIGDNYTQEWSLEIEEDEQAVNFLVGFLINKGLMIDCGSDEFEITKTKSLVGSETSSAERKRRQRERLAPVTAIESVTMSQVGHTEIEIETELDKDKDIDKDIDKDKDNSILLKLLESNGLMITPTLFQDIEHNISEFGYDLTKKAFEIAIDKCKRGSKTKYAYGILRNWKNEGVKTLEDTEQEDRSDWSWAEKKAGFKEV